MPDGNVGAWARELEGVDAVVNLAGEGIADRRWSDSRKKVLESSRILPTRSLATAVVGMARPPATFVNASAVGYYGPHGNENVTEQTPAGSDFLGQLCAAWEREAAPITAVSRLVLIRTGIVLHPDGGALRSMLLPFRLGLGGPMGSGTQFIPWIHRADWVELVVSLLGRSETRGAVNLTAPTPVDNAHFTRALGQALRRPAIMPLPAFALRLALGEMADALLTGQRAIPVRATELGFAFRFATVENALRDLLQ